jgi:deoxyribodipyrimidine photo-lyase
MVDNQKCQINSTLLSALEDSYFITPSRPAQAASHIKAIMQADLFQQPDQKPSHMDWIPTREAGLARLAAFVPLAGSAYARGRNTDFGPEDRSNVSCLSPYLARRMIIEEEVVAAVLKHHSFAAAEKFIQEVFWRTYWKGWLEMRPDVLVAFNKSRLDLRTRLQTDPMLAKRLDAAMTGQTGIACFDAWVGELVALGWLHNHTRMWFASIWIFTLGLPWQLGADFFYKHLLDADAASNTLSWRWVAGLHTKGKHYLARASNIATHTNGRFDPSGRLNESASPLQEAYMVPGPSGLPAAGTVTSDKVGLLVTSEDLHPVSLDIGAKVVGAACLAPINIGSPEGPRNCFSVGALADAHGRVRQDFDTEVTVVTTTDDVVAWATALGVREVVTAYVPTGLVAWHMREIASALAKANIKLVQIRRPWDAKAWPLATGGFFKLKEKLPTLISKLVSS